MSNLINANITNNYPKLEFQQSSDNISKHRELIVSKSFERGIQYALAHYHRLLTERNPNEAMMSHFKSAGAEEFVKELRMLAEKPKIPQIVPKPSDNLPGNTN